MKFDTIGSSYSLDWFAYWVDHTTLYLDDVYLEPILYIFKSDSWDNLAISEFRNWVLNTNRSNYGYYNAGDEFGEEVW